GSETWQACWEGVRPLAPLSARSSESRRAAPDGGRREAHASRRADTAGRSGRRGRRRALGRTRLRTCARASAFRNARRSLGGRGAVEPPSWRRGSPERCPGPPRRAPRAPLGGARRSAVVLLAARRGARPRADSCRGRWGRAPVLLGNAARSV